LIIALINIPTYAITCFMYYIAINLYKDIFIFSAAYYGLIIITSTASTSSKTNSETKALGSIKLDYQQFGLDSSLFKVKQLTILAQTVAVEDVAKIRYQK
jgi:hypothetical protein